MKLFKLSIILMCNFIFLYVLYYVANNYYVPRIQQSLEKKIETKFKDMKMLSNVRFKVLGRDVYFKGECKNDTEFNIIKNGVNNVQGIDNIDFNDLVVYNYVYEKKENKSNSGTYDIDKFEITKKNNSKKKLTIFSLKTVNDEIILDGFLPNFNIKNKILLSIMDVKHKNLQIVDNLKILPDSLKNNYGNMLWANRLHRVLPIYCSTISNPSLTINLANSNSPINVKLGGTVNTKSTLEYFYKLISHLDDINEINISNINIKKQSNINSRHTLNKQINQNININLKINPSILIKLRNNNINTLAYGFNNNDKNTLKEKLEDIFNTKIDIQHINTTHKHDIKKILQQLNNLFIDKKYLTKANIYITKNQIELDDLSNEIEKKPILLSLNN